MKKTMLITVAMTAILAIFVGTALAVDKRCTKNQVCRGTDQPDGLTGTNIADNILGLGANDIIYAFPGNDKVDGGTGNDFLRGDDGDDRMYGMTGSDSVIGSDGDDLLYGDDREDRMTGADNVAGADGKDRSYGGPGNDLLGNIQFGDDLVTDKGRDRLFGGPGNDRFYTRDDERDAINCGTGNNDTVYKDRVDTVTADCENVWVYTPNSRTAFETFGEASDAAVPADAEAVSGS